MGDHVTSSLGNFRNIDLILRTTVMERQLFPASFNEKERLPSQVPAVPAAPPGRGLGSAALLLRHSRAAGLVHAAGKDPACVFGLLLLFL